ncbi:MAG: hypothetical protein QM831_14795 [Kofleriaceae bacterium]
MKLVAVAMVCALGCTNAGKGLLAAGTVGVVGGYAMMRSGTCGESTAGVADRTIMVQPCAPNDTEAEVGAVLMVEGSAWLFGFLIEEVTYAVDKDRH